MVIALRIEFLHANFIMILFFFIVISKIIHYYWIINYMTSKMFSLPNVSYIKSFWNIVSNVDGKEFPEYGGTFFFSLTCIPLWILDFVAIRNHVKMKKPSQEFMSTLLDCKIRFNIFDIQMLSFLKIYKTKIPISF